MFRDRADVKSALFSKVVDTLDKSGVISKDNLYMPVKSEEYTSADDRSKLIVYILKPITDRG